jgi:hypothetical protein
VDFDMPQKQPAHVGSGPGKKHVFSCSQVGSPANQSKPDLCKLSKRELILRKLLLCSAIILISSVNNGKSLAMLAMGAPVQTSTQVLSAPALDRQIDRVLQRPEFDWRLPNTQESKTSPFLERCLDLIRQAMVSVGRGLEAALKWILRFFGERQIVPLSGNTGITFPTGFLAALTYVLVFAIAGALIFFVVRVFRARRSPQAIPTVVSPEPDLAGETTSANQLPSEEWYALARQKIADGDLRQGQRAMFFAILSHLGNRRFIALERWKSNCDYEFELGRRARHLPQLPPLYTESRLRFERSWYGEYTLTPADLEQYAGIYERIKDAAS